MLLQHLSDPDTKLYVGDSRHIIPENIEKKSVQLIFADPPFGTGVEYGGTWDDNISFSDYLNFSEAWIDSCLEALAPNGSIFINVPDNVVAEIAVYLKMCKMTLVNWCIWHFRFGVWRPGNFIVSKSHCLYFCKNPKDRIWNGDAILVPSDRATKYNDKRTKDTTNPGLRPPLDVWCNENDGSGWARVQGNNKERRPLHPNQLPEAYLSRIIKAASNPGDLVLDPFCGSGTTSTVARTLGRRSVTIEIDPTMAASAAERIKSGAIRVGG